MNVSLIFRFPVVCRLWVLCVYGIAGSWGLVLTGGAALGQTIRYVSATGTSTNPATATTWATATTDLQGAIDDSNAGDQVWVKAGTYYPGGPANTDRGISFFMKAGVGIYGGFAGGEALLSQRPGVNPVAGAGGAAQPSSSTLSGNIGEAGSVADNSYHVVRNPAGLTGTARLDGFVITGGNADGASINLHGGGIYNENTNPTLVNCSLQANAASLGGGIFNNSASPILVNCSLQANAANIDGGGIFNNRSSPVLVNCSLQANTARIDGGAIYNGTSTLTLINCSLQANQASNGGAIFNTNSNTTLTNCILFGNSGSGAIALPSGGVTATYCLFERGVTGYTGSNNLITSVSPFATGSGTQLAAGSPAINAGNPASVTVADGPYSSLSLPATDLVGNPRISGCAVDMGAVEFPLPTAAPPTRLYVNATATGIKTGLSWTDAFTDLQSALTYSCSQNLTEIWVAAGVYKPTGTPERPGTDRSSSFAFKNGLAVYGGFAGTETSLSQRPAINPVGGQASASILSGDIGTVGVNTDNVYHVINNSGLNRTAVLDGFVITGGNANGTAFDTDSDGGAILNRNSSPKLTNCSLQNNTAGDGGAIFNDSSSPTLTNCSLLNNTASFGGAIYNQSSSPRLTNCSLQNNTASGSGGGIYNDRGSSPTLTNCVVFGHGGSKTFFNDGTSSITATYSLFDASVTNYPTTGTGNKTTTTTPFVSANSVALAPGSPAINAGNNAAYVTASGPATDLLGNPRIYPTGGLIDMGAVEFQGALPVTLAYFNGRMTAAGAVLGWATAREENNARFQLERSRDPTRTGGSTGPGFAFESIATMPSLAPDGNSVTELTYSFLDAQPLPGTNYYRLMQTDRDGTRTTHNIIALSRDGAAPVLFPNPVSASGEAVIEPGIAHTGYQISDVLGRVVQRVDAPGLLGRVSLAGLPAGVYLLHVQTTDGSGRMFRLLR